MCVEEPIAEGDVLFRITEDGVRRIIAAVALVVLGAAIAFSKRKGESMADEPSAANPDMAVLGGD